MAWAKVIEGSNWSYYDTVGFMTNKALRPGTYRVRWPDGTITEEACQESCHRIDMWDMGQRDESDDCHLYFIREIHGHEVRVRLRGLEIEVADPPPVKKQPLTIPVYWSDGTITEI